MKPYPDLIISFIANHGDLRNIENVLISSDYQLLNFPDVLRVTTHVQELEERSIARYLDNEEFLLVDYISKNMPALIIFQVDNEKIPINNWTWNMKRSPATRRYPLLCYLTMPASSQHLERKFFADHIYDRYDLFYSFEDIVQKIGYRIDLQEILEDCGTDISENTKLGIACFNNRKYFEAHEFFEIAWLREEKSNKNLNRALLQVAIAYYHIHRRNFSGAIKVLLRLRQWIYPLPGNCGSINITELRNDTDRIFYELLHLGPRNLNKFNFELCKNIKYT